MQCARGQETECLPGEKGGHAYALDEKWMDDLQKGVWSGGALIFLKSGMCLYYKHGRELTRSTDMSPVDTKHGACEKKPFWKRRCVADHIAPHVVNAYMLK